MSTHKKPAKFDFMQITFVDTETSWQRFLPLTYTRPVSDLRIGILKIHEKWAHALHVDHVFFKTKDYLSTHYAAPSAKMLWLYGGLLPSPGVLEVITSLKENEALVHDGTLLAGYFEPEEEFMIEGRSVVQLQSAVLANYPWDIFRLNGQEIGQDFTLLTKGRTSKPVRDIHTRIYGDQLFLEEGVTLRAAVLNAENGPIYLGKGAEVQEGAVIKGPFALCEQGVVNMGAKIRGDTTIGPYSKVGEEVSNSVIQGYANKGHDGFL
ncbi:MAG: putative sugar nucleotidyl transferase, partial [Bacteroidota bacterium]